MIIILGILLAIAVPSYLSFKDRANKSAAQANVRAVLPDVESYNADNVAGALAASDPDFATSNADNGYQGMTAAELKTTYDQAFPTGVWIIGSPDVSATARRRTDRRRHHRRRRPDRDELLHRLAERLLVRLEARPRRHHLREQRARGHLRAVTPAHGSRAEAALCAASAHFTD